MVQSVNITASDSCQLKTLWVLTQSCTDQYRLPCTVSFRIILMFSLKDGRPDIVARHLSSSIY